MSNARDITTGMTIDTDAGPRKVLSAETHRPPLSGSEMVTIKIDGYQHPIHLQSTEKLNIVAADHEAMERAYA